MITLSEGELAKLKQVELDILVEVDRVCRKLGISYWLDAGTLLGAARHSGFIPWDDDIDIAMLRDDYERFLEVAPVELSSGFTLCERRTQRDMIQSFAKVRRDGTRYVEGSTEGKDAHQGIWIDVFPFDTISAEEDSRRKKRFQWAVYHKLFALRAVESASTTASYLKRAARCIVRSPLLLFNKEPFYDKLDSLADDVPVVGNWLTCFHYSSYYVDVPADFVFPLGRLCFEGVSFPVPGNWEGYLEAEYGDWHQMPSEEKRHPHHDVIELDFGDGTR